MGRSEGWSKQGSTSKKCVPTTREVLIDHLRAKSRCVVAQVEEEDVAQLVRDASNEDMLRLLCDSDLLRHRLEGIVLERSKKLGLKHNISPEQEELGERLFVRVASIDSELCAQITGMLLELDASEIKRLLVNPSDLAVAVAKAKMEYVQFVQKEERSSAATTTTTPSGRFNTAQAQEIIGETLYTIVQNDYPDDASQITGMLLEMDSSSLIQLLDRPALLQEKMRLASEVLRTTSGAATSSDVQ